MPRLVSWSAFAAAALLLAGCATKPAQQQVTLKIAATASFEPVLRELAQEYTAEQPWVKIELHIATNTAKLQEDLKEGAAYDLFIPSRGQSMEALAQSDAIVPKSRVLLAFNQLVVVAPRDSNLPLDLSAIESPDVHQVAVADPNTLMLGFQTRQALTNMRFLPSHEAKPLVDASTSGNADATPPASPTSPDTTDLESKLLVVPDEASVLAAVKDGRAQIGITYCTLAVADKDVRVLTSLPPAIYEAEVYSVAIPRNAPHYDEAWLFLNFLRSDQAHEMMQRGGLLVN
jgi:molybdate transport system substrate-binding protein